MTHAKGDGQRLVLALDGGGTKTLARIVRRDGSGNLQTLAETRAGCSNIVAAGDAVAFAELQQAVTATARSAEVTLGDVTHTVLALAGSNRNDVRKKITSWTETLGLGGALQIIHDAYAVLAAGTADCCGVAVIAGTGSSAFGRNAAGETAVAGGWGYLLGDEGSAFWLGRAAVRAMAADFDSNSAPREWQKNILCTIGVETVRQIPAVLTAASDARQLLASLAPAVTTAADEGEPLATEIVTGAAAELAKLIWTVAARLSLPDGYAVATAGGVLCGCKVLQAQLQATLADHSPGPGAFESVSTPIDGCVNLAMADA